MTDPNIEPKEAPTRDSIIDSAAEAVEAKFNGAGTQDPEAAPLEHETDGQPDAGGEPAQQTPTGKPDVDDGKGFASHPAWIEREQKLKEAQARADKIQATLDSLLDEPKNYERYLKSQGFSDDEIRRAMGGKQVSQPKGMDDQAKISMAEEICKELGWNFNALNDQQKDYIRDTVTMNEKLFEKLISKTLDQRLKPLEENESQRQLSRNLELGYDAAKKSASEEFPEFDWDKDILPAMTAYLDELDKRDPKMTIAISPQDLYEKATRNILKEKKFRDSRQAERNVNKQNARPLTPGIQSNVSQGAKPKTWRDRVEQAIANR